MNQDYGRKVGLALQAVQQLHADSLRLLQDCDMTIGQGRDSLFGNKVGDDYDTRIDKKWMAEGVFRFYDASKVKPGLVEAITLCFVDLQTPSKVVEPMLLAGQVQYRLSSEKDLHGQLYCWELWEAFFTWSKDQRTGAVLMPEPQDHDRIEWLTVLAVPLYSVSDIKVVQSVMQQVREFKHKGTSSRGRSARIR